MTDFRHGLVIGKFYPPHAGHLYLASAAARHCEQVTVVCMAATQESIPLERRVAWLREALAEHANVTVSGIVDDVPVDYHDPAIWQAHEDLMREAIANADAARASACSAKAVMAHPTPASVVIRGSSGTPAAAGAAVATSGRQGRLAGQAPSPTPVDAVFTSEGYGEELARRFNAASVCLDPARALYPVSGTAVRADPVAHWDLLPAMVQAWLCLRVVIVGAESTGKSTLAANLTRHYQQQPGLFSRTRLVAEFGREHSQDKLAIARAQARRAGRPLPGPEQLDWSPEEFEFIARRQNALENTAARASGPLLICDTDAFATSLWHERYMGAPSPALVPLATPASPHRLYLLSDVQAVPFTQDGLRDGEHIREWMHGRFGQALAASDHACRRVSGDEAQMLAQALAHIDEHLPTLWRFAAPLG